MNVSSAADRKSARKFEEVLGPGARRYFGDGYRRTTYSIEHFGAVKETGAQGLTAGACVAYPSDWSVKEGATRRPHLSTVDALVLGASAAHRALTALCGLDERQVRWAWFSDLTIRAGARPTIDLDQVSVRCDVEGRRHDEVGGSSVLRLKIGTFHMTATVRHPTAPRGFTPEALPGSGAYTTLYRDTEHQSWITRIDADPARIECVHEVVADRTQQGHIAGIEAAYGPQPTLIDSLVLAGQMQQVLIATADGATRESSGNLWMRRISFETRTPWRPSRSRSELAIIGRRDLSRAGTVLHGLEVRCTDVCGVDITAQVAYSEGSG